MNGWCFGAPGCCVVALSLAGCGTRKLDFGEAPKSEDRAPAPATPTGFEGASAMGVIPPVPAQNSSPAPLPSPEEIGDTLDQDCVLKESTSDGSTCTLLAACPGSLSDDTVLMSALCERRSETEVVCGCEGSNLQAYFEVGDATALPCERMANLCRLATAEAESCSAESELTEGGCYSGRKCALPVGGYYLNWDEYGSCTFRTDLPGAQLAECVCAKRNLRLDVEVALAPGAMPSDACRTASDVCANESGELPSVESCALEGEFHDSSQCRAEWTCTHVPLTPDITEVRRGLAVECEADAPTACVCVNAGYGVHLQRPSDETNPCVALLQRCAAVTPPI